MSLFGPDQLEEAAQRVLDAEQLPEGTKVAIVATASSRNGGELALVAMAKAGDGWEFSGIVGHSHDDGLSAAGKVRFVWP